MLSEMVPGSYIRISFRRGDRIHIALCRVWKIIIIAQIILNLTPIKKITNILIYFFKKMLALVCEENEVWRFNL